MVNLLPNQDLSFEEALAQLEEVVARLEAGQLPLTEAVGHYERGMALAAYCGDLLDSAELRVREIDAAVDEAPGDDYDLDEEIDHLLFKES